MNRSVPHTCFKIARLQQLLQVVPPFSQQTEQDVSRSVKATVKGVFVAIFSFFVVLQPLTLS